MVTVYFYSVSTYKLHLKSLWGSVMAALFLNFGGVVVWVCYGCVCWVNKRRECIVSAVMAVMPIRRE